MNEIVIISDVHGRTFWKEAVARYPDADTIFLGDYHDPYGDEDITENDSLENFIEVLDYARIHPNCHLLLGNHDLHYLCDFGEACRLDFNNEETIRNLLCSHINLFSIAAYRVIKDKTVMFSHAPVLQEWLDLIGAPDNVPQLVNTLNCLSKTVAGHPQEIERMLGYISCFRGGDDIVGSCVWADVREIFDNQLISTADYSIFAHTRSRKAIITDRWANLDCRQAFLLHPDLTLSPITTPDREPARDLR